MAPIHNPAGRPMLIGSQPLSDHDEATQLVLTHVPEIPNWVQLPAFRQEGMVAQFADGLPGLVSDNDRIYVDTDGTRYDEQMTAFFQAYLDAADPENRPPRSPFALTEHCARGFFRFLDALSKQPPADLFAVKGQITGPITFCTSLTDQNRRAIFYNENLRDAAVKMLALKAAWQVEQLGRFGVPVILFIDEPALAGYGSSEFISISREDITGALKEVIAAVHLQGGAAGVHVCANTDWSLLLGKEVDIVNFDASAYFDKFRLYARQIDDFLTDGGCLAWGLVPTAQPAQVASATLEGLWDQWQEQINHLAAMGLATEKIRRQALITPSCGTGSLPPEASRKVLALTRALSGRIRAS